MVFTTTVAQPFTIKVAQPFTIKVAQPFRAASAVGRPEGLRYRSLRSRQNVTFTASCT